MRIEIKARNLTIDEDLRRRIIRRFDKVARQVSPLAEMEVELREERNPSIRNSQIVEVTLHVKGRTLRAQEASDSMIHAVNLVEEDLSRQVKRHRDKRRNRRGAAKEQLRAAAS